MGHTGHGAVGTLAMCVLAACSSAPDHPRIMQGDEAGHVPVASTVGGSDAPCNGSPEKSASCDVDGGSNGNGHNMQNGYIPPALPGRGPCHSSADCPAGSFCNRRAQKCEKSSGTWGAPCSDDAECVDLECISSEASGARYCGLLPETCTTADDCLAERQACEVALQHRCSAACSFDRCRVTPF